MRRLLSLVPALGEAFHVERKSNPEPRLQNRGQTLVGGTVVRLQPRRLSLLSEQRPAPLGAPGPWHSGGRFGNHCLVVLYQHLLSLKGHGWKWVHHSTQTHWFPLSFAGILPEPARCPLDQAAAREFRVSTAAVVPATEGAEAFCLGVPLTGAMICPLPSPSGPTPAHPPFCWLGHQSRGSRNGTG